jgi:hypothetical protein
MDINNKLTTGLFVAGITVLGAAAGSILSTLPTSAANNTDTTTSSNNSAVTQAAFDPAKGGHVGQNGKKEELLTGDTAEKVKAAALAAYPGSTVQRVETAAEGAAFEAHMTKADGTQITVKFDSGYKITGTETGGPGGPGGSQRDSSSNT